MFTFLHPITVDKLGEIFSKTLVHQFRHFVNAQVEVLSEFGQVKLWIEKGFFVLHFLEHLAFQRCEGFGIK